MKNIVIITANAIRHNYFKMMFAQSPEINVLRTYAEAYADLDLSYKKIDTAGLEDFEAVHFAERHNTECDFFADTIENSNDHSKTKLISSGEINDEKIVNEIIKLNPDLIITYGCSIIKSSLLEVFKNRILNVHLGLSPYYFGAGTNFHALANGEFQFFGYTFMHMDEGIDTGKIIHQSRGEFMPLDNPHQVGNRLIKKMTKDFARLVARFDEVVEKKKVTDFIGATYKKKDATLAVTKALYKKFSQGAVAEYLKNEEKLALRHPIIEQNFLKED